MPHFSTAGSDGKALGDLNWFPEQIVRCLSITQFSAREIRINPKLSESLQPEHQDFLYTRDQRHDTTLSV